MAKITYFLDARKANSEGKFPLVLNVSHRTKTTRISTGHHFTKDEWAQVYLSIRNDNPCKWNRVTEDIASLKTTYDVALNRINREENIAEMTALRLRDRLLESVTGTSPTKKREKVTPADR